MPNKGSYSVKGIPKTQEKIYAGYVKAVNPGEERILFTETNGRKVVIAGGGTRKMRGGAPKTEQEIKASKAAQKATQQAAAAQKKVNAKAAKAAGKAAAPAGSAKPPMGAVPAAPAGSAKPPKGAVPAAPTGKPAAGKPVASGYTQFNVVTTVPVVDPKKVAPFLQKNARTKSLTVLNAHPSVPASIVSARGSTAKASKGSTGSMGAASSKLVALGDPVGNRPFDFRALMAKPGTPVELRGAQLSTRVPFLGPGQMIHGLADQATGVIYSEFAVDDNGLRIFRIFGTPQQIAAGSKTLVAKVQLEEIMTGPGGYMTLLRDLQDEEIRVKGSIQFYEGRISSYEASLNNLEPHEQRPLKSRIKRLQVSLQRSQQELVEIAKEVVGFKAASQKAAAMGAPLKGGSNRWRSKMRHNKMKRRGNSTKKHRR